MHHFPNIELDDYRFAPVSVIVFAVLLTNHLVFS